MDKKYKIAIGLGILGLGYYLYTKTKKTAEPQSEAPQVPQEDIIAEESILPTTDLFQNDEVFTSPRTSVTTSGTTTTGGVTSPISPTALPQIPRLPSIPRLTTQQDCGNINVARAREECSRRGRGYVFSNCKCNAPVKDPRTESPFLPPNVSQGIVQGITSATITPVWTADTNPNLGCFVAGTLISMADGEDKKIEDVKVGDIVWAWDGTKKEPCVVGKTMRFVKDNIYEFKFGGDTKLTCTEEHPIYIKDKGWITASNVNIDDKAQNINGIYTLVTGKRLTNLKGVDVFNISVMKNPNYYANGILVHNKGEFDEQTYTGQTAVDIFTAIQNAYDEFMAGDTTQGDSLEITRTEPRIVQSIKEI